MTTRSGGCKGFVLLEAVIALCVAGVLFGVVIVKYRQVALAAQETAVKAELTNIRTSIQLFKMLKGRNPADLKEMIEKNVMLPARIGPGPYSGSIFQRKYLMANAVDSHGNVLDAFGNYFCYNPADGEVKPSSKGCEPW